MALVFQIADDCVPTEASLAKYLFHFEQILLLQSHFEEVVSVVDLSHLHLTLPREGVDLILHEERYIDWLFDALEGACSLTVAREHILDVSRCRVDESVVLVEAAALHLGALLLLIEELEVLRQHH